MTKEARAVSGLRGGACVIARRRSDDAMTCVLSFSHIFFFFGKIPGLPKSKLTFKLWVIVLDHGYTLTVDIPGLKAFVNPVLLREVGRHVFHSVDVSGNPCERTSILPPCTGLNASHTRTHAHTHTHPGSSEADREVGIGRVLGEMDARSEEHTSELQSR